MDIQQQQQVSQVSLLQYCSEFYYSTVVSFTTALYHSRYASRARLGCQRHVIACDRDRTDRTESALPCELNDSLQLLNIQVGPRSNPAGHIFSLRTR